MTRKGKRLTGGIMALLALAASTGSALAQDLYVANFAGNKVSRITPQGVVSTFATGFNNPYGLAFSPERELFVSNFGDGTISRVSNTGVVSNFALSGVALQSPVGMTFASNGDLYVADFGTGDIGAGSIKRITPQGVVSTFASGLTAPSEMAFSALGDLYVSNYGGGVATGIYKITSTGTVSSYLSSGFVSQPYGLAFSGNDLYIANAGNDRVSKKAPTGAPTTFVNTGALNNPMGMAFASSGDLYVASQGNNSISKVSRTGVVSTFVASAGSTLEQPASIAFLFPAGGAAIPEPGTLVLLGLGAVVGAARLRRRTR